MRERDFGRVHFRASAFVDAKSEMTKNEGKCRAVSKERSGAPV